MKADVFFACLVAVLALGIYAEFDANDKVWGDISLIISRIMGGLTMSNFFLWDGLMAGDDWHTYFMDKDKFSYTRVGPNDVFAITADCDKF